MVASARNGNTWEVEAGEPEFKVSFDCLLSSCVS